MPTSTVSTLQSISFLHHQLVGIGVDWIRSDNERHNYDYSYGHSATRPEGNGVRHLRHPRAVEKPILVNNTPPR